MADQLSNDLAALRIARDEAPPSGGWIKPTVIVLALAGAVGAGYVFGLPALEQRVFKAEVELTQIVAVSPTEAEAKLTSTGYVVPQRTSKVGAKIAGRIDAVHVAEGDQVEAGQVIAELDAGDLNAQVETARARIAAAKAEVQTAKAELADAEQKARRERKLVEAGAAGKAAAEDLEARVAPAQRRVAAAEANVKALRAEADALEVNLGYLTITAPISGVVVAKPAQAGEIVGIQAAQIVELADFESLVVETDVPEGKLHLIAQGDPCDIILDAYPDRTLGGRVKETSPRVNRAKATVTVKVGFEGDREGVLPEMSARVTFLAKERDPGAEREKPKIVVPAAAITERDGGKVVFVFDDGEVRVRSIQTGEEIGTGYELLEGPGPGTRVVRDPTEQLTDRQKVKEQGKSS
jgi:RND family efflux transporter MFP subunit